MRTSGWGLRGLLGAALAAGAVMVGSANAYACSCAIPSVDGDIRSHSAVFVAELGSQPIWRADERWVTEVRYQAEVIAVYQGDVEPGVVLQGGGGMCGLDLTGDQRYLVFADLTDGRYYVSNCSSSTMLGADRWGQSHPVAEVESILGTPTVPEPPAPVAEASEDSVRPDVAGPWAVLAGLAADLVRMALHLV